MKTTWLANKWIWSAVVVALFAVGCGEGAAVTTNCTYKPFTIPEGTSASIRANCEVSGDVLTVYRGGSIFLTMDNDRQEMIFYPDDPEPSGTVTISPDGKTWRFVTTDYGTGVEVILD